MKRNLSEEHQRLIRLIKNGINGYSTEDKFLNFYTVFEEIARIETEEFIINKCKNCASEVNTGRKATKNFIKKLLLSHEIKDNQIEKIFKLRNKIAHGGAKKNKKYLADVLLAASYLEEVTMIEVEKRINDKIINRLEAHIVDIPIVTYEYIALGKDEFKFINSNIEIPARFIKLKGGETKGELVDIGLAANNTIHSFAWPDILYAK